MTVAFHEIVPGVVAWFDVATLLKDAQVSYVDYSVVFRNGPFVCAEVSGTRSLWLHTTRQPGARNIRLELKPEWKQGGGKTWQNERQFITDARSPFIGPSASFIAASTGEMAFNHFDRPSLTQDGVTAVFAEMKKYHAQTL